MQIKELLSETGRNLLAHWITAACLFVGTLAVPYWGVISANWSWPGAVAVGIVVAAACLVIWGRVVARGKIPAAPTPSAETPKPPAPSNLNPVVMVQPWLEVLADQDDQQISNRIRPLNLCATNIPHLDAPNPYVDLNIPFMNASVFVLTSTRLEGRFKYRGYDLLAMPELFQKTIFGHATEGSIVIRQWFTPDIAQEILASRPVSIDSGNVAVWFSYSNRAGDSKEARSSIGNSVFEIR